MQVENALVSNICILIPPYKELFIQKFHLWFHKEIKTVIFEWCGGGGAIYSFGICKGITHGTFELENRS